VWDAQHQKTLLDSRDIAYATDISFSLDGHFFICGTGGPEFCLWKESPDGYLPYQKFVSSASHDYLHLVISPKGESIVSFHGPILQL